MKSRIHQLVDACDNEVILEKLLQLFLPYSPVNMPDELTDG